MKIISQQEKYNIDEKINKIKDTTMIDYVYAQAPFNIDNIVYREIENDGMCMSIPYSDIELTDIVNGLAYEIANNNDWVYPDYQNIKVAIIVSTIDEKFSATLRIDIEPAKFSDKTKADILKDTIIPSEYENWINIFTSAEDFYNGDDGMSETTGFYPIEFTYEEQSNLLWFLLQHII
ncbi:MAG: hypothetical protein RR847_04870 [Bacilli bacterium]